MTYDYVHDNKHWCIIVYEQSFKEILSLMDNDIFSGNGGHTILLWLLQ